MCVAHSPIELPYASPDLDGHGRPDALASRAVVVGVHLHGGHPVHGAGEHPCGGRVREQRELERGRVPLVDANGTHSPVVLSDPGHVRSARGRGRLRPPQVRGGTTTNETTLLGPSNGRAPCASPIASPATEARQRRVTLVSEDRLRWRTRSARRARDSGTQAEGARQMQS